MTKFVKKNELNNNWYEIDASNAVGLAGENSYLDGGDRDDVIESGSGDDTIYGGNNDDVINPSR